MSGSAAVFVGLDCGGSTCRSLAVSATGDEVFRGQSGAANLATTPEPVLRAHLSHATEGCPDPTAVCACFAGLLTSDDRRRATSLLRELFPHATVRVEPDYAAAFASAIAPIDVCVIAGTGALICSKKDATWVKSGGGGYLLGDEGSAFDLGRRALQQFLYGDEAPSPQTISLIGHLFEATAKDEIVARLYGSASPPALLAKLAPALANDASAGYVYAVNALENAMGALASLTIKHIQRHGPQAGTVRIGLAGGMWKTSPNVLKVFTSSIRGQLDRSFDVTRLRRPPVYGATALAKELTLGN